MGEVFRWRRVPSALAVLLGLLALGACLVDPVSKRLVRQAARDKAVTKLRQRPVPVSIGRAIGHHSRIIGVAPRGRQVLTER